MTTEDTPIKTARKKSGFAYDVLKLVSGTTFAQFISILAAPLLTRLYAPEAFGIWSLFISITSIVGIIACMSYENAIMLPKSDEEATNLLGVSLGFTLLISLLMVPLAWWSRTTILKWLNALTLGSYLWLVPLVVLVNGLFVALNYWNSRTRHFGRLSIARVTSSLTTIPMTLVLGFAGYTTAGSMIGAGIAGQTVATTVLGVQIWRDDRKIFLKSVRWQAMRECIKRYKKFPLYESWASLMNTISAQVPSLLLATFFTSSVVGFYSLGYRLLSMPMALIGASIQQVFFQRAAAAKHDERLSFIVHNTFTRLSILGLFPFLLVMILGKEIFPLIFGSRWAEAGIYAQILAPWVFFNFVSSPISALFEVLEMQGRYFIFNSILLTTRIASLMIGGFFNSVKVSLMLFSITGSIIYFCLCLFFLDKAGLTMKVLFRDIYQMILIAFILILPVIVLKNYGVQTWAVVIVGCLCGLIYYAILYYRDKELKKLMTFIIH